MSYVDGFVAAVPAENRETYRQFAEEAAALFKEYGALSVVECWQSDVPEGKINSFHSAVLRKPEEAVVFSWIVWPSKEVRDAGHQRMYADPRMNDPARPMPFDGSRLIYGGFDMILSA